MTTLFCTACVAAVGDGRTAHPASVPTAVSGRVSVVDWAVLGGRLSVVVRNDGPRELLAARAVLIARDRRGTVVAAASGPADTACCLVSDLAPGAESAVFADLGTAAWRVASVRVATVAAAVPATSPQLVVRAGDVALQTDGAGTVVRAAVTATASASVLVRAVLADQRGRVVVALATRVTCVTAGAPAPVSLDLGQPAPDATLVQSISVTPVGTC